jgi:hypothetical protein
MRIEKEVEIFNGKWKLTYCTFTRVFGFKRRLLLIMIEIGGARSINLYNYDHYCYLHLNHDVTPYMFETVLDAKVKIIKFLLNENI